MGHEQALELVNEATEVPSDEWPRRSPVADLSIWFGDRCSRLKTEIGIVGIVDGPRRKRAQTSACTLPGRFKRQIVPTDHLQVRSQQQ